MLSTRKTIKRSFKKDLEGSRVLRHASREFKNILEGEDFRTLHHPLVFKGIDPRMTSRQEQKQT
jgi:hypothetical protein